MGNGYWQYLPQRVKSLHVSSRENGGDSTVLAINRIIKEE